MAISKRNQPKQYGTGQEKADKTIFSGTVIAGFFSTSWRMARMASVKICYYVCTFEPTCKKNSNLLKILNTHCSIVI
ncbi:MAG: hypothetical protein ACTHMM_10410 [Agriterribacter sp.]